MSLRTRLIIAFLLLSVVPLSAVTLFSYVSSVNAVENAARREATRDAADISQRMELITADVGRRMDRIFEARPGEPGMIATAGEMRDRVGPALGETAALVDRLEFHPMDDVDPDPNPDPAHDPLPEPGSPKPRASAGGPAGPRAPKPPTVGGAPPPPAAPRAPPTAMVIDVPGVIAEARRAARESAAKTPEMASMIERGLEIGLPAAEASLKAVAEALAAGQPATAAAIRDMQMEVEGRKVEIAVKKGGKLLGKANATLNLDRTLQTVLTFARRDQGEIPFAIDRRGGLYTPDAKQKPMLQSLQVDQHAPIAATRGPRRVGEWLVVARQDASGLTFGIARPMASSLREIRRASVRTLSLGLLVIGLALVGIVPISHRMTRHLSSLSDGVHRLAGGDFATRVPVRSKDEFGSLAAAFNQMAEDLERHQSLVVEQGRLRRELELSRLIQTEMLPRTGLRSGPAEIKGISIPAREVGGDFFNYFVLPDGRLALLVGDVSGKGVSAALLMANVQATLRARLPLETDLAALAADLDRDIDKTTPRGVYFTLFIGILETDGRTLRYVNAGHNPQFVLRRDGGIVPMASTGLPIALFPEHGYHEISIAIDPGDLLFFYTDGLVEAENEAGEIFGADRLQSILAADQAEGIDTVLAHVDQVVRTFRGGTEPLDDATMMALRLQA
jgi:serine phosphatase RsbU (regulator of sigma subunit)